MLKKIGAFFKKSDNDWLNVTVSIVFSIVMIMFLSKTILNSYALPTELPATLTTGMGNVLTDRVSLFNELDGEEIISLVPYYATDDSGTKYTVYCLEKDKGWPSNDKPQTITKSDAPLDAGYVYILQNAYPNKSLTGNDKNDDYLTQVAIWFYQDRVNGVSDDSNGVLTANQKSVIKSSAYYEVIEPLLEGAVNAKNNPVTINPSFSISSNDFKLSSDNKYLVTDLITVNSNVTFNDYVVSINNSAVEVLDSNNNVINGTAIQYGSGFKLRVDLSKINDPFTVDISVIANYIEYQAYSYNPPSNMADSMQQSVVGTLVGVPKQKTVSTNVSMPTGSLTIRKVDSSNNNPLAGANIEVIRKATNTVVEQFTTTTSNHVISNLLPGEYEIKETSAPSGYYIDNASTNVVITDSNLNVTSTISNSKFTVMIRKVDANTGNPISGAILNILNSDNELMDTITVGSDYVSLDTSKYKEGTYKVVEVQAPDGYLLSDKEIEFTLNKDNPNVTIYFPDEKNEVLIEKKDSSNNQLIAGATLRLVRVSDNLVIDEWTTTTSAHKISSLARGEYKVIEIKAPNGYSLSSSEVPITITGEETEPVTATFYNSTNQVTITKVDENGNPLSGAVLRITKADGEPVVTITTKDEPYILNKLEAGTYKIEEIKAPDGYFLNTEPQTFVVDENTTNLQVTFTNTESFIYIGKVDTDTNQYVGGATLKLSSTDGSYSETFTSKTEAIKVKVPYGSYTLEEIEAPLGYVRTTEPLEINFDEYSPRDYVYQLANQKRKVIISKIDSETNEPLLGSILGLYDSNKDYLCDINLTSAPSTDIASLLEPGTYYIKEKQAPTGYILDNSWHKIEIKDTLEEITLEIENKPLIVNLGKIDAKTGEYIEGARMRLTGNNDFSPLEFISLNEPYQVKLSAGTYTLEEIEAPKGYVGTGSKVSFEVLNTGKVQNINISNDINSITINNRTLIIKAGADYKFRLEKTTGELIEEFTTTDDGYTLDNLDIGNYILRQVDTPEGILLNEEPLYFSISDTNSLNSINYVNDFTKVYISKKDMANSAEVPGAHLVIIDNNDNIIDEWVSTDTPHYIEKLPVGKYTLKETISPDGYVLNTSVIDFEVLETGEIQSEVMFNSKPVEVPNTSSNATYIYLIGGVLILIGGALIYISYVNKTKIKSR